MQIWLAEDEAPQREHLAALLRQVCAARGVACELRAFEDGQALVDAYAPGVICSFWISTCLSGMDAAHRIRERDERVLIVFCTNLVARALDGYAVAALDFLVKPITENRLDDLLDKALRRLGPAAPAALTLHTQDTTAVVPVRDILYAETYGRKVRLHTVCETLDLRMTLSALESHLPENAFFRIHNACLVSLAHVDRISGCDVTIGGDILPVSRHKKRDFLKALTSFMGEQL
ncbi:MAG: LytR/AlgR family response regulator transcription factor [Christensenellales bacterium]